MDTIAQSGHDKILTKYKTPNIIQNRILTKKIINNFRHSTLKDTMLIFPFSFVC